MINRLFVLRLCLALLLVGGLILTAAVKNNAEAVFEDFVDGLSGEVYTMVDADGRVIMRTARRIFEGDEYIDRNNNYYRVRSVNGTTAEAELIKKITLAEPQPESLPARLERLLQQSLPVQQRKEAKSKKVAIYNSHGAESYLKGDGTESKDPGGGIIDVAAELQKALEAKGIKVIRSREPHTPHDAGAYQRSRRTVEEALKENPDALIDVHRDAVPEEEYLEEVKGKERVQIQLVVGRQNQNMANNRQFAEGLKKKADEKYPGLVKGIFMARGNYNQDMSPRAVLIEVGSHTNEKGQAEESVNFFSEVVNDYLYGTAEGEQAASPAPTTSRGPGGTALRAVMWIVLGLVAAVGIYLLISTGGWEQLKGRVKSFRRRELSDLFGGRGKEDGEDGGGDEGS
ncbi:MAG TPA: stage II sporulation protein P [Firmicutes bacterium]|nr:stage II sporulation protein P [Bacillota bacterium]